MTPPSKGCIAAVKELMDHHQDDAAAYYSLDGESAVVIIRDETLLTLIMNAMPLVAGEMSSAISSEEAERLLSIMLPIDPIEA